jgi:hypothetical protein
MIGILLKQQINTFKNQTNQNIVKRLKQQNIHYLEHLSNLFKKFLQKRRR